ncbi:MAG: DUF3501 family protein [Myxococcota bacterium]
MTTESFAPIHTPLTEEDLWADMEYERLRPAVRRAVARDQAILRVRLGDDAMLVFEPRWSLWLQVQEALRHVESGDRRARTIDAHNARRARSGEVAATLFGVAIKAPTAVQLILFGQEYAASTSSASVSHLRFRRSRAVNDQPHALIWGEHAVALTEAQARAVGVSFGLAHAPDQTPRWGPLAVEAAE